MNRCRVREARATRGLRAGLIGPWHGALGLLAAALQFGSATLARWVVDSGGVLGLLGLAGWLMWVVWIVGYGVVLIRREPDASARGFGGGVRRASA
ncbi:hypothetical protein ABZZ04_19545 [Streptomyces sp. NPDC006435]|uniref:hypothetical protein n=1 Tax=Streptomyces sp. NPDC006435 TaxID=3154300 RepID=UPI0033BBCA51